MSRGDNHESQFTSGNDNLIQELEEGNRRGLLQLLLAFPAAFVLSGAIWGL